MSKIEDFIHQHREELDDEPNEQVWQQIERKLAAASQPKNVKMVPMKRVWQSVAAVAVFAACIVAFQGYYYGSLAPADRVENVLQPTVTLEQINPELAEAEEYYVSQIDQMKKQLVGYNPKQYGLDQTFEQDLNELEKNYQELKKELYQEGNMIISDAMIQNLQQRLEILNQQLEVLNHLQQEQKGRKTNNEV